MLVLDTSITMTWCFADESSPTSAGVLRRVEAEGATVPSLWPVEVANALLVGERRRRLTEADLSRFLRLLHALPLRIEEVAWPTVLGPVRVLARDQRLSVYDASFLELALRSGLPLATQDQRLRAAAERVGLELVPAIMDRV